MIFIGMEGALAGIVLSYFSSLACHRVFLCLSYDSSIGEKSWRQWREGFAGALLAEGLKLVAGR